MIVYGDRLLRPGPPLVPERAHQLFLLGVYAYHRMTGSRETLPQLANVSKLLITYFSTNRGGGYAFLVHPQREAQIL